jgi:WhiB family transcriptional regulator, redox-sensing transcriptional regulator
VSHLHLVPDPEPARDPDRWQSLGACVGKSPDVWFPYQARGAPDPNRLKPAIAICATCPVIDQCGRAAVENKEQLGIWGGEDFGNARTRRRMRDKYGPPPSPTSKHCPRCDRTLPFADFGKDRSQKLGLATYCKSCARAIWHADAERREQRRMG